MDAESVAPPPAPGSVMVVVIDLGLAMVALAGAIVCAAASCLVRAALLRRASCQPPEERRLSTNTSPTADGETALARAARAASAALTDDARREARAALGAVPAWQRAVVAIGARSDKGPPRLVGSAFFVDGTARLLCTCCHVIDDIATMARVAHHSPAHSTVLDPNIHGVALGFGSPAKWTHLALVRIVSPPPAPRDERNGLDLAVLQLVAPLPAPERALLAPAACRRASSSQCSKQPRSMEALGCTGDVMGLGVPAVPNLGLSRAAGTDSPTEVGGSSSCSSPHSTASNDPSSSSTSSTSASSAAAAASTAEGECHAEPPEPPEPPMPEVVCLPLGHEGSLSIGDDVVLLGYGQAGRGAGPPSATNTRGVFAGSCEHPTTGSWLRTDALMLSGHSGGPLVNRRGEVVGWSVRSGFDRVLNGDGLYASGLNEVRPASALMQPLTDALGGRRPSNIGVIPPGAHTLGEVEAREAVMAALAHAFATVGGCHSPRAASASSASSDDTASDAPSELNTAEMRVPRLGLGGMPLSGSSPPLSDVRSGSSDGELPTAASPRRPRFFSAAHAMADLFGVPPSPPPAPTRPSPRASPIAANPFATRERRPVINLLTWLRRGGGERGEIALAQPAISREVSPQREGDTASPGGLEAARPFGSSVREHSYSAACRPEPMYPPCHPAVYRV